MSIFRRGRRWIANFQHNGKQCRKSLATSNKKEARRKAVLLEAQIIEGRFAPAKIAPAIKDVVDAYLAHQRTERRAVKTIAKSKLVIRRLLALAKERRATTVLEIDLQFVDAYRAMRVASDAKPKTLLNESIILRQIVNFAIVRGAIGNDPLRGLKLKKCKASEQPCWTREQVDKILSASEPPHLPALFLLSETGVRIGEAKFLTWNDVDFNLGLIHIRPKDDWRPKTGDRRTIPMSPRLRDLLLGLPRCSRWVLTAAPSKRYPRGDHQISERRLLQYLKRVLRRLGLNGHLHTFRHAFISNAAIRGIPEAVIRKWVGHVDPDILKTYTHVVDDASQAAM